MFSFLVESCDWIDDVRSWTTVDHCEKIKRVPEGRLKWRDGTSNFCNRKTVDDDK